MKKIHRCLRKVIGKSTKIMVPNYIGETGALDIPGVGYASFSVYYNNTDNEYFPFTITFSRIVKGKKVSSVESSLSCAFEGIFSNACGKPCVPLAARLINNTAQKVTFHVCIFFQDESVNVYSEELEHVYIAMSPKMADEYLDKGSIKYAYSNNEGEFFAVDLEVPGLKELISATRLNSPAADASIVDKDS